MATGRLVGRLLIFIIVSLFDAVDDVDADDGIQWLGDACNDDDDCHDAFNLLCERSRCVCKTGFVAAQFSCQPASAKPNIQSVIDHLSCQLPLTSAMLGLFARNSDAKFPAASLGDSCTYHAQCQYKDPHSACDLSGKCNCVDGFAPRRDGVATKKCTATGADSEHVVDSYGTGFVTFGIVVLALSIMLAVACLFKFVICNWNQQSQPPPPRPPRKISRKYSYLTVGYTKDGETQTLLPKARRPPPTYSEATNVPQITISDYSSISHPKTFVYSST